MSAPTGSLKKPSAFRALAPLLALAFLLAGVPAAAKVY